MNKWSLSQLLAGLHDDIESRLSLARKSFGHPTTKGDASEEVWLEMLRKYLPERYQAARAHVVDSRGMFSEQIDVVIFDRQYSPIIFNFQAQTIIPAESIYGAFEAKQAINADEVAYAQGKVASVRRLHRTSLPIPHAGGTRRSLLVVTPETVVRWHRAGFRLYWSLISKARKQIGRKKLSTEVRELVFRVVAENSTWGAPRIHGELLMLGFDVSERTISR